MVNPAKATDGMLDVIAELSRNRDNVRAWLEIYQEANMIDPTVASHLWEVLTGLDAVTDGEEE